MLSEERLEKQPWISLLIVWRGSWKVEGIGIRCSPDRDARLGCVIECVRKVFGGSASCVSSLKLMMPGRDVSEILIPTAETHSLASLSCFCLISASSSSIALILSAMSSISACRRSRALVAVCRLRIFLASMLSSLVL